MRMDEYCNLAYSNQSVLLGSELVFLVQRSNMSGGVHYVHFDGFFKHLSKLTVIC